MDSSSPLHIYSGAQVAPEFLDINALLDRSQPPSLQRDKLNASAKDLDQRLRQGLFSLLKRGVKNIFNRRLLKKGSQLLKKGSVLTRSAEVAGPLALIAMSTIEAYKGASDMAKHGPGPTTRRLLRATEHVGSKTGHPILESLGALPLENITNTVDTIREQWQKNAKVQHSNAGWSTKFLSALTLSSDIAVAPLQGIGKTLQRRLQFLPAPIPKPTLRKDCTRKILK